VDLSRGQTVPDVRHVVLRRVDLPSRTLAFHVDARSPKFHQLQRTATLKWLFYDPPTRLQVRIAASVALHHMTDLARSRWEASQPMSRLCYLTPFTPGQPVTLPPTQAGRAIDPNFGFENFGVVETTAHDLDCLYLHHQGHRRAYIDYRHPTPQARWIAP
jgi:3-hydroxyisobutyrate dehydrogenase